MKHLPVNKSSVLAIVVFLAFGTTVQAQTTSEEAKKERGVQEKKARNFDEVLEQLDRSMIQLDAELKKELKAIPPIDAQKIKAEVEQALKQLDAAKLKMEIESSVAKIDVEKIKAEISKIKELELPKMEEQLKNLGPQIEESLKGAKESIEKAKVEIKEYKAFEESLAADGLIDKNDYRIEHKEGELKINGKTQPKSVYEKYSNFLQKHKNFTLRKNKDDFNINND
ncbi:MAG: hypothetical protein JWP69_1596 [Flaviaesturariibacter sp.]|nr:hypothetical protein [Flaviaesturariibacter sp.]